MVSASTSSLLGVGLYTPAEAARYGRIPSSRMAARWVRGTSNRPSVLRAELEDDPDRFISFRDFVQLQAIRAIQLFDPSIKLPKIREAIEFFETRHDVQYPLARKHDLIPHGKDLWINVEGVKLLNDSVSLFEQATGRGGKGQLMIRHIAEQYQRDMAYHQGGLARSFVLYRHGDQKIVMDPDVQFGQPMLDCGYSLNALIDAYRAEGSSEAAAKVYGIDEIYVDLALDCHNHLGFLAA